MAMAVRTKTPQRLRTNSTDVERKLWHALRNRQLSGLKFRRQYPIEGYITDFASIEARLIIELDGGQHALTVTRDARRTEVIEAYGFTVPRFWNNEVTQNLDGVLESIRLAARH
jgi:very-short-patch-repair endonuclease